MFDVPAVPRRMFQWALAAPAALVISIASASPGPDDRAKDALDALSRAHTGYAALRVEASWTDRPGDSDPWRSWAIVNHEGTFAEVTWSTAEDVKPGDVPKDYKHFAFWNGATSRSYAVSAHFVEAEPRGYGSTPPGPVQWVLCPWPIVPTWAAWLKGASDLEFAEADGRYSASSRSARIGMEWDASGRLLSVRWGDPGVGGIEHRFENFAPSPPHWPRTMIKRAFRPGPNNSPLVATTTHAITVTPTTADDPALVFRPAAFGVHRLDQGTGNVYSYETGQLMYNQRERDARAMGRTYWPKYYPWMYSGVGLAMVAGLLFYLRRTGRI
ncbi:MAG: hypothetical protein HRU70_07840 [Phycisphaeraceae bacterium]|nr:MAG: hypothetical protein HRU70_07840 [Phycisphaeraceae bacterium]